MATLLLCLSGPLQAWGTRSRFRDRDTERFPSKSGVVGLCCAALGRPRTEPADDLAALRLGVRADRPGRLETDFHVTQGILRASGKVSADPLPSYRHYLADAVFLAGLEGERDLLARLHERLERPVWTLFLGRKSFVPSWPVWLPDGLRDEPLEAALRGYPWLPSLGGGRARPWSGDRAALEIECGPGEPGEPRQDQPVGPLADRAFGVRCVRPARPQAEEGGS